MHFFAFEASLRTSSLLGALVYYYNLGTSNSLTEPNEEVQMDFAGPILFKNNSLNNYILVTVDRLSRLPHAETYINSPTTIASTLRPTGPIIQFEDSDSHNSENIPLKQATMDSTPSRKIYPSKIHITIGDKTTKFITSGNKIARKSLARKTKEPRHALGPQ